MNSKEKTCKTCENFYQHYGIDELNIWEINCGHCKYKRGVTPDKKACEYYQKTNRYTKPAKKKVIKETLEEIYDRLEHIKLFLDNK